MNQQKEQKLSLYFKTKGNPTFKISPKTKIVNEGNDLVCIWDMDPKSIKKISVDLISANENESLTINKIVLGDVDLLHLDQFGVYKLNSGRTKKTYGYMDEPGTYTFKVRYNAKSHHYITSLISQKSFY